MYKHTTGFIPDPKTLAEALLAIKQHRQTGGMSEAQRVQWTQTLQAADRNGCHLDADSIRELGDVHTSASIIQTLLMWSHDAGEVI